MREQPDELHAALLAQHLAAYPSGTPEREALTQAWMMGYYQGRAPRDQWDPLWSPNPYWEKSKEPAKVEF